MAPPFKVERWIELRCPSCGAPAGRVRRARVAIGSPVERCAGCGGFVSRSPCQEWDLLGPAARASFLGEKAARTLAFGALPGIAYLLVATVRNQPLDHWKLLAFFAGGILVAGFVTVSGISQAVRRSKRRMNDPMYRARLVEYGRRGVGAPGREPAP